ncbi:MAG: hypothetical protein AAGM22_03260 [Acidobacteriota bacterium]
MALKQWIGVALMAALTTAASIGAESQDAADSVGEDKEKALAVLTKADGAAKAVTAVRFESSVEPTGFMVEFMGAASGHGVMAGWNPELGMPARFYGVATTDRDGKKAKLEGGGDGETFYIIDHLTRKGYEDIDPEVMGTIGAALRGIGMLEFVHVEPFGDEFGAEMSYLGTELVGDVMCDKVHVVYTGGRGESTWYFSQEDHLPRRRVRHFDNGGAAGAIDIRVLKLETSPELEGVPFTMRLPDDYEQVDDFAP